jgi:hypothetical protein
LWITKKSAIISELYNLEKCRMKLHQKKTSGEEERKKVRGMFQ